MPIIFDYNEPQGAERKKVRGEVCREIVIDTHDLTVSGCVDEFITGPGGENVRVASPTHFCVQLTPDVFQQMLTLVLSLAREQNELAPSTVSVT